MRDVVADLVAPCIGGVGVGWGGGWDCVYWALQQYGWDVGAVCIRMIEWSWHVESGSAVARGRTGALERLCRNGPISQPTAHRRTLHMRLVEMDRSV